MVAARGWHTRLGVYFPSAANAYINTNDNADTDTVSYGNSNNHPNCYDNIYSHSACHTSSLGARYLAGVASVL